MLKTQKRPSICGQCMMDAINIKFVCTLIILKVGETVFFTTGFIILNNPE